MQIPQPAPADAGSALPMLDITGVRLQRVEELSGQSLSDPRGIASLSIAAEGARLLGGKLTC